MGGGGGEGEGEKVGISLERLHFREGKCATISFESFVGETHLGEGPLFRSDTPNNADGDDEEQGSDERNALPLSNKVVPEPHKATLPPSSDPKLLRLDLITAKNILRHTHTKPMLLRDLLHAGPDCEHQICVEGEHHREEHRTSTDVDHGEDP